MSRRVVIQGSNADPFRVGSPGVNADTANLFDLFFDGNQSPLRIWGTGFVSVAPMSSSDSAPAHFVAAQAIIATPPGTFPVFIINGRASYNPNAQASVLQTVSNGSGGGLFGGIVANNTIYGINFKHQVVVQGGVAPLTNALVNYCIFRNYG